MTQAKLSSPIDLKSLVEMIDSLELQEKIELRKLLDRDIATTQQKSQNEAIAYQDIQELEPAVECFRRGWDDVMNNKTRPIAELWDGIDVD